MNRNRNILIAILSIMFVLIVINLSFDSNKNNPPAYTPTKFYNRNGQINQPMRVYMDTFVATSATPTIDISPAGFTQIAGVNIMAMRNTSTATSSPQISIKSYSTSSIVANITEGNATLVTILGLSVLQGASMQFVATPSTVTLCVFAIGY